MVASKFGGVVHSLKEVYPELFAIAVDKDASVNSYLENQRGGRTHGISALLENWNWRKIESLIAK